MEESPPPAQPVSILVVVARIVVVTGMSISGAIAIFFFVAGVWQVGLPALGLSVLFVALMFFIERAAA
ncbi:MAG: hypothetical protein IH864_06410 [Chloroflexi bacterium]|nr:hypothetical protein [Chloroflexota bacterium]